MPVDEGPVPHVIVVRLPPPPRLAPGPWVVKPVLAGIFCTLGILCATLGVIGIAIEIRNAIDKQRWLASATL